VAGDARSEPTASLREWGPIRPGGRVTGHLGEWVRRNRAAGLCHVASVDLSAAATNNAADEFGDRVIGCARSWGRTATLTARTALTV
jgi:hypothetical protein